MPSKSTTDEAWSQQRVNIRSTNEFYPVLINARYIKELAERLNSLESQLGPQHPHLPFPGTPYTATGVAEGPHNGPETHSVETSAQSRKRTYADMAHEATGQQAHLSPGRANPDATSIKTSRLKSKRICVLIQCSACASRALTFGRAHGAYC